jgi:hypothetical protein
MNKLITVDPKLQFLAVEVIRISPIDFAITSGLRTTEEQQELYKQGKSKYDGITNKSKHQEGKAIDICPCIDGKLDYMAINDLFFITGLFYLKAKEIQEKYELTGGNEGLNINLRLGAFWNGNSIKNNSFVDGYHIELI